MGKPTKIEDLCTRFDTNREQVMFASIFFGMVLAFTAGLSAANIAKEPFFKWSQDKAVQILNSSPWARQETFTQIVSGQGSGRSGEKEIYNTFYVRFLSARPIREAYARIQQIYYGYDRMNREEQARFEKDQQPGIEMMRTSEWIVVSVAFRSNDPNEESNVRRFFQTETVKTLKTKAFLSTPTCSQVEVRAYFPPREESVGAKFIFPRIVDGIPVVTEDCDTVTFELLDVPGANPNLQSTFSVKSMVVDGKIIL
jgi:hypothetical protein